MTLQEYKLWARTKRRVLSKTQDWRNASLGALGELGEIADTIKKWEFHGHELDHEALAHEFGDLFFYLVWQADIIFPKIDLEEAFYNSTIENVYEIDFSDLTHYASLSLSQDAMSSLSTLDLVTSLQMAFLLSKKYLPSEYTFSNILEMNVAKLDKRYPEGFSEELSKNRQ